ncbi:MAG TPA: (2Fe-2S) ferredoxin domain-containing protein [Candidatus Angelobacter sp.]|nr:(2Fe-2S) ferredoxin domain-containing protein [Candidatus Angelobacter sp.]
MPKFARHIFICGNQRPDGHPRGSCDRAGTADLHRAFKASLAQTLVRATVRANKAGCLDQCEHGPTVVVYPEAVWYGHVTLADVDEIVQSHIVGGKPVDRLQIADACLNAATCEHRKPSSR